MITRRLQRVVARCLVGILLLGHIAIAAYACPGLAPKSPERVAESAGSTVDAPLAGCDSMVGDMDPESAALCAEHCKQGRQGHQAPTVTVPPALPVTLYQTTLFPDRPTVPRRSAAPPSALLAGASPHTVLHCVYRF